MGLIVPGTAGTLPQVASHERRHVSLVTCLCVRRKEKEKKKRDTGIGNEIC